MSEKKEEAKKKYPVPGSFWLDKIRPKVKDGRVNILLHDYSVKEDHVFISVMNGQIMELTTEQIPEQLEPIEVNIKIKNPDKENDWLVVEAGMDPWVTESFEEDEILDD